MAVNPLDTYRIVADTTMDPAAKRAALDALYAPASATPAAVPDARLAYDPNAPLGSTASVPDAPPVAPPSIADVGPNMSAAPAPTMSAISPEALAAAAASKASTPGTLAPEAPAAASAAAPMTDDQALSAGVQALMTGALQGAPAHRVAAHDQPVSSVEAHAAAIPEDIKRRLADDAAAQASTAVEQGEAAAKSHLDAAIAADNGAHAARAERDALAARQAAGQKHLQDLDTGFERLVKDTEVKPSDWWASKDAGHKVLAVISAVMFGLARDPQGLQKVIDDDLALKQVQREKKLDARKSAIDDFRARLLSPEAAATADRALAAQAVAAEATRLAEAAAAPEARLRGQQVAQQFQSEADRLAAQMAEHEAGTVQTHIAHVPERVVGGRPDPLAVIKRGKEAGLNPEGIVRKLAGGAYGTEASPDEAERRVTFGGGDQVGYVANKGTQPEMQNMATALSGLRGAYSRILELSRSTGHTLAGPEKAALEANIASAMLKLQATAKGEGANARLAGEMLERLEPLTGAAAIKTGTLDANARAQIKEASRLVDDQIESLKGTLTPSPKTTPVGGKIETLGKSKRSLGFVED